jgi:hypothetical protein
MCAQPLAELMGLVNAGSSLFVGKVAVLSGSNFGNLAKQNVVSTREASAKVPWQVF